MQNMPMVNLISVDFPFIYSDKFYMCWKIRAVIIIIIIIIICYIGHGAILMTIQ